MIRLVTALALAAFQQTPPAAPPSSPAAAPAATAAPKELLVVLQPRVEVHHTPVRLADVAEIQGPALEVARFEKLALCPAPVAGRPRLVTPAGVRLAARLAGLDLKREGVVGAPQVEIVANWEELTPDELVAAAQQWLLSRSSELGDRILLDPAAKPEAIGLLQGGGPAAFECAFVGKPRGGGQAQIKVAVSQGGTLIGERVATFNIRRFGKQLRLLTNVRRGEEVAPSQVVALDGEWTSVTGTPIVDPAALRGLVATRELAAGAVLVRDAFEQPLLVDRGGAVRVVLHDGLLQIVATSVAQRAGRRGETIPVMNPETQRLLQVQLVEKSASGEVVALVR